MKTISTAKKKSGHTALWVIAGVILVIGGSLFTLWNLGIGPFSGRNAVVETTSVAYLDAAAGGGTEVSAIITYREIPADSSIAIPDDCVFRGDDVSGYVLKTDMFANTMLTWSMLTTDQRTTTIDPTSRYIEVSYVDLQSYLKVGDFIDIRLKTYNTTTADGNNVAASPNTSYRDDVVVSKKEVVNLDGGTMTLSLNEEELLLLQAAGVEMSIINSAQNETKTAATLYVTIYVNPAIQNTYAVTYSNDDVVNMLRNNPGLADSIINSSDSPDSEDTVHSQLTEE